ncbi:MAG: hypothetical protein KKH79_04950, partial [Candidatus Thermoplasmatota archaeon]|nr:hypothetical protein [Candidatus Thermoplasmatota archaeon]
AFWVIQSFCILENPACQGGDVRYSPGPRMPGETHYADLAWRAFPSSFASHVKYKKVGTAGTSFLAGLHAGLS